jgi:hypothetical protein
MVSAAAGHILMTSHSQDTDTRERVARDWLIMPDRVRLWEDEFHVLHISVDSVEFHDVTPRRVFPLSGKADFVSFVGEDDKEVVLLSHPSRLDKESRSCLEKALGRMHYTPKILRVDEISEAMGVGLWKVLTDRGYAVFEVAERNRHIRTFPNGRYVISDVDGNRFEIENVNELDAKSRKVVDSET